MRSEFILGKRDKRDFKARFSLVTPLVTRALVSCCTTNARHALFEKKRKNKIKPFSPPFLTSQILFRSTYSHSSSLLHVLSQTILSLSSSVEFTAFFHVAILPIPSLFQYLPGFTPSLFLKPLPQVPYELTQFFPFSHPYLPPQLSNFHTQSLNLTQLIRARAHPPIKIHS